MPAKSVNTFQISTFGKDLCNNKFVLFLIILLMSAIISLWSIRPELSNLQKSWGKLTISGKFISNQNKYQRTNSTDNKTELKYILYWTPRDWHPLVDYEIKQKAFFDNKCEVSNCFVTDNRTYFGGDLKKFDAIFFNGRNIHQYSRNTLPLQRYPHQIYVYANSESAENYPMCSEMYKNYFNWTLTYKLDSTIQYLYIKIKDTNGNPVGPNSNMNWVKDMKDVNDSFAKSLESKTKAAAWFVSNCHTRGRREYYVKVLQKELNKYKLKVDIYGGCGNLTCSRSDDRICHEMLRKDYYFYLAFENSIIDDYVTEKLLIGLKHNTVPIVYGGANYSRFLPPGSYLNARTQTPEQLAATMNSLIKSPKDYRQYFKWQSHYTYSGHDLSNVCRFCSQLNDDKVVENPTFIKDFRTWWHADFVKRCA